MKKIEINRMEMLQGGTSCTGKILAGFFSGMLAGAGAGAPFLGPGIALGGTYGSIAGALSAYALC